MDDQDLDEIFDLYPALAAVSRFTRLIPNTPWFRHVGDPMDPELKRDAERYAAGLGFPDVEPAVLALWEDAAAAAESLDVNSPAWEAEEQLRMALSLDAASQVDDAALELVLTHVSAVAADAATAGAEEVRSFLQIGDEAFARAAAGAGVQICHNAALVLAAGGDSDHPFSLKFQLFEHGRWPIAIVGGSLNIF